MLHRLPPPDTSVRRRRGYQAIGSDQEQTNVPSAAAENLPVSPIDDADAEEGTMDEAPNGAGLEKDKPEGWAPLAWSFAVSGTMTVSMVRTLGFGRILM